MAVVCAVAVVLPAVSTSAHAADAATSVTGTKFKADADMQGVLQELAALGGKPIESLTPEEARMQPTPADAGPFPVVVYFHGGGWVIADKQVYDGGARALAKEAKAIVVSVDYRRSPEAKFPAAWDDALASYKWVSENAASMKGDPKRMALAGESAGGNLAVSTAVAVRDAGLQMPTHVLAVYPVAQTGNLNTKSYVDSATAKPLNKPEDKTNPRLDIVNANLKGLPPVTIINAQIDPLREDGAMLQSALKKAGVKVDRKLYSGVTHEFFGMGAAVKKAAEAEKLGGQALAASFRK